MPLRYFSKPLVYEVSFSKGIQWVILNRSHVFRYKGMLKNVQFIISAGVCDATGLVFGLMPYPEAVYAKWLHPDHTRNTAPGPESSDVLGEWEREGLQIFRNAVDYVKANL